MTIEQSKEEVAKKLAQSHRAVDPEIQAIIRIWTGRESDPEEPIKLIEVSAGTTASGVFPIGFGAHIPSGILFPTEVVELHTSEFEKVKRGELPLPPGWSLEKSKPIK